MSESSSSERKSIASRAADFAAIHGLDDVVRDALVEVLRDLQHAARAAGAGHLPPAAPAGQITLVMEQFSSSDGDEPVEENEEARDSLSAGHRYEDLGLLGRGGMGEVRRVLDRALGRTVAMKVIRREMLPRPQAVARFLAEVRVTSQLQHPSIVPVYEVGRLDDGRMFFTMREVSGQTLGGLIGAVHEASADGRWANAPGGWNLSRLLEVYRKVCEAMGYAHSRGVVHRDLKPGNVLVGDFGDVMVVDWGLAKIVGRQAPEIPDAEPGTAETPMEPSADVHNTAVGTVAGTPAYMAPEQARGEVDRVGPASDVYALGAILFEILTGSPPRQGVHPAVLLHTADDARDGLDEEPLDGQGRPRADDEALPRLRLPIPEELAALCTHALEAEARDRPSDGGALAEAIGAWLEGTYRRDRALKVLAEAEAIAPEHERLEARARSMSALADELLKKLPADAPPVDKSPAWALQEQGHRLQRSAKLRVVERVELLRAALTHDPSLTEAQLRLVEHYQSRHALAEAHGDQDAADAFEMLLRKHSAQIPDKRAVVAYLEGTGAISLHTDPPGAEVFLYRYTERDRRLVAVPASRNGRERREGQEPALLGRTPLRSLPMGMGSYLLVIRAQGRVEVRYPVHVTRQHHWDGVPPDGAGPEPVFLPPLSALGTDDVYVPAGWFWGGGDSEAMGAIPRSRLWVNGFVMRRYPVTHAQYLDFLNSVSDRAQSRGWSLDDLVPRRLAVVGGPAEVLYRRDERGRYHLPERGHFGRPDQPVVLVPYAATVAYATWLAERDGLPWRLPGELEWEKAARGVDARPYPWGAFLDPSFCHMAGSRIHEPGPSAVRSFPVDESPYGVRGLAGNVREWCVEAFREEGPEPGPDGRVRVRWPPEPGHVARVVRGSCWDAHARYVRLPHRHWMNPAFRFDNQGFRLVRSTG